MTPSTVNGLRIGDAAGRGARVVFRYDGRDVAAHEGESIAAALLASGVRGMDGQAVSSMPRRLFCAMGVCQQCVVVVDGARVEACRTPVRRGLEVRTVVW